MEILDVQKHLTDHCWIVEIIVDHVQIRKILQRTNTIAGVIRFAFPGKYQLLFHLVEHRTDRDHLLEQFGRVFYRLHELFGTVHEYLNVQSRRVVPSDCKAHGVCKRSVYLKPIS